MKVRVSIKNAIYKDLEIIATAQQKPVARLVRELLEQDVVIDTIHELAIMTEYAQIQANKKTTSNHPSKL